MFRVMASSPSFQPATSAAYGRNDAAGLSTQLKRQRRAKVAILSGAHVDVVTPDARGINLQKHFSWRHIWNGVLLPSVTLPAHRNRRIVLLSYLFSLKCLSDTIQQLRRSHETYSKLHESTLWNLALSPRPAKRVLRRLLKKQP